MMPAAMIRKCFWPHEFDPFYSTGEMEEEEGKPEDPALEAEVKADKTQKSNGWEIAAIGLLP